TSFEKLFRPAIIQVLDNPLTATQLGDAVLAAQPRQHDADLLLRRKLPPRGAPNLLHNLLCRFLNRPGFLSHLRSFNGYDGPEILPSSTQPICLIGADAGQSKRIRREKAAKRERKCAHSGSSHHASRLEMK